VRHSGRDEILIAAPARSRRLVNRQPHLPFDDDPPLGAVAMFRHGGILARLEQSRRRGPSLQQSQGDASQSRVGFGQLLDVEIGPGQSADPRRSPVARE